MLNLGGQGMDMIMAIEKINSYEPARTKCME